MPADLVYDPKRNPHGVRCTFQDDQVNVWGRDPATGFARRPLDNTGVQYGLAALRSGAISAADFVALNAAVGGVDIDGNPAPQRMDMGADVARIAYDTGRVTGRGALDQTPIIDNHPNLDLVPVVDVHDAARPFMTRARMDAHLGGHGSQGLWQGLPTRPTASPRRAVAHRHRGEPVRVTGGDGGGDPAGQRIGPVHPPLRCRPARHGAVRALAAASPRIAAGGPRSDDVLKCSLKAVDGADYKGLSPADVAGLRHIFPTGVCNWAAPGVGETPRSRLWLSFGDAAPAARPFPLHNVVARSASTGAAVLASRSARGAGGRVGPPRHRRRRAMDAPRQPPCCSPA